MKYLFSIVCVMSLGAGVAMADSEMPCYVPCDGVYYVGHSARQSGVIASPTMVAPAYSAKFRICNTLVSAALVGDKSYSLQKYQRGDTLDLTTFMGVGECTKLIVRNASGGSYQLGSMGDTGLSDCVLWAAKDYTAQNNGSRYLPLSMYNAWDCPVSYESDGQLAQSGGVTVQYSKPGEGLVVNAMEFVLAGEGLADNASLSVTFAEGNDVEHYTLGADALVAVGQSESHQLYHVHIDMGERVIREAFSITVSGFEQPGVNVWLSHTVDTNGLFASHTAYANGEVMAGGDACIDVMGYYNYMGDWGIPQGKQERGEVISEGDYVQIYYDPSEEGYIDRFQGEITFPVECSFGINDIYTKECPEWISTAADDSQWEANEALFLMMQAQPLPENLEGRLGKVVFSTADDASQYTILVIQGSAWFDNEPDPDVIETLPVSSDSDSKKLFNGHIIILHDGEVYDISGHQL